MPNTLLFAWVKNVYSLGIQTGITSVHSYTESLSLTHLPHQAVDKLSKLSRIVPAFPPQLSTYFLDKLPPLYNHLYPLSTEPIITKTKEN